MKKLCVKLFRLKGKSGATLFEYVVIVSIISIVGVVILASIGKTTSNSMTPISNGLQ